MSSLMEMLTSQLGGDNLRQIGQAIGTDDRKTEAATGAALSTLIGALARNASGGGEQAKSLHKALEKDHDGSVLGQLAGLVGKPESGAGDGILRHVLGGNRSRVEAGLAQTTGVDKGSMGKLMTMLAPVVMGALGKQQRESGMDAGSLANFLGEQRQEIQRREPQAEGILGKLLDTDQDGDVDLGDLAKHGAGLLGKFFNK